MVAAEERAVQFLAANQRRDGAFVPLWFGNQAEEREENPVLGTARVLAGLSARREHVRAREISRRGVAWLLSAQNIDGGWGGGPGVPSTVEETAVALSGLAPYLTAEWHSSEIWEAVRRGTLWVRAAWEARRFDPVPVGLYFARLWYAEDLYPLIFTTGALESIALAERAEWHHHASR